ncbi:hypothetical protein [Actinoplanes lobatus]|uniref:Uncharacterized protein n=1 Tax=Actinoplanes lobatus TaxID=113568 RepID=A0A7W7MGC3_9ACTN|nr:hypothetical protein [Actinoplanes lobatus]MBB4749131.1 hypothetical protein [Actinoplanes lobatus]
MTWEEFVAANIPDAMATAVTVQQYTGSGAYGDTYADAIDLTPCVIEDVRRAVVVQTVDAYGSEHLSSSTVFAPLNPEIKPGSLAVIPWRSRPARIIAVARLLAPGLALPEHQELSLE